MAKLQFIGFLLTEPTTCFCGLSGCGLTGRMYFPRLTLHVRLERIGSICASARVCQKQDLRCFPAIGHSKCLMNQAQRAISAIFPNPPPSILGIQENIIARAEIIRPEDCNSWHSLEVYFCVERRLTKWGAICGFDSGSSLVNII